MWIDVRLFAQARDLARTNIVRLSLPDGAVVADAKAGLTADVPQLRPIATVLLWAVNNVHADDSAELREGDEVACFPPVSGG